MEEVGEKRGTVKEDQGEHKVHAQLGQDAPDKDATSGGSGSCNCNCRGGVSQCRGRAIRTVPRAHWANGVNGANWGHLPQPSWTWPASIDTIAALPTMPLPPHPLDAKEASFAPVAAPPLPLIGSARCIPSGQHTCWPFERLGWWALCKAVIGRGNYGKDKRMMWQWR